MAKVLVIGSGGREHAIAWTLERGGHKVWVTPGNAGTQNAALDAADFNQIAQFVQKQAIDLTVVGPEAPLAAGIVDWFEARGLPIFGPTQEAARLEGSKDFAKQLMQISGVPTAQFASFGSQEAALDFLADPPFEALVVKADGLAAGKGVVVCDNLDQAREAVRKLFATQTTILLEERLSGPEVSLLAFCDGHTALPMVSARDHKRIFDNDQGPNTGGMGVFAPVPGMDAGWCEQMRQQVFLPILQAMRARGTPYVGVLYAGLMLTPEGVKVLEFNARFGDPETQVILPLLQSDLYGVMRACIQGSLDQVKLEFSSQSAVGVVLAAPGYPQSYPKGLPIQLEPLPEDTLLFHAGTLQQDTLVTAGGRVMCVTALGSNLAAARAKAYQAVSRVYFEGMHYRTDIGRSA
jgi:phosphoribosylamine---glycine ligase